jgi:aminoglycoside phosphotransferase (APT) family kinase protein
MPLRDPDPSPERARRTIHCLAHAPTPTDAPETAIIRTLLRQVLATSTDLAVERVLDGVSTFVYRVHSRNETLYLRVWPFADETLESEALALETLQRLSVRVPRVIVSEAFNPLIGRSYLLTSEIPGRPLGSSDSPEVIKNVLIEAGRELGVLHSVPVEGFGWIARHAGPGHPLHGEQPSYRAFMTGCLESDLIVLATRTFSGTEIAAIQKQLETHTAWLEVADARLAHGDFDTTPIFHQDGKYSGMIDFSEMRGASQHYDLAHFGLHDGHRLPVQGLPWLVEGYTQVADLPADYEQRLAFVGLLIGIRRLAHAIQLRPTVLEYQRVMAHSIRQQMITLGLTSGKAVARLSFRT